MNKKEKENIDYQKKIDEARKTLFLIIDDRCGKPKAEILLNKCDVSTVNTIELLMYIGRDFEYKNRRKPAKNPLSIFISNAKYYNIYANEDKQTAVKSILGKIHYQNYLRRSIRILSIRNWEKEVYL